MGEKNKQLWSEAERRAFAPPIRQTPTEWAECNRVLPPQVSAEAGRYKVARTPYLRAIMDAVADVEIEEIVCLKAAQVGWSEAIRNILGYWVDNDPGPCLLVMPSEDAARDTVEERIRPLIETCPAVKRHTSDRTSDNTKSGIKFDTMSLHIGWAGSPQALASRPCRYILLDECDKYPRFSGVEADPISLARERTKTFLHRKKVLIGSTPTVRQGHVWRAWETCGNKRDYYCPCPHCGHYQTLVWSQVKWDKLTEDKQKLADVVEQHRLAWYECQACKAKIIEASKARMIGAGVWLSEGQTIDKAGTISGDKPKSKRVGFRINAINSPWLSFSAVAAEGLRSMGDQQRWMNFKNSWLAEVFEERISGIKTDEIKQRAATAPKANLIPKWAGCTIASVDVQGDRFYYIVRAWGHNFKSQLISHGVLLSFEEIAERLLCTVMPVEDGTPALVDLLVIDSGFKTDEVYEFATRDSRVVAIKGANHRLVSPIRISANAGKEFGIAMREIDTQYFKDRFSTLRSDRDRWLVNTDVTDEYCQHMASEHKVRVNHKGNVVEKWDTVTKGAPNHFFDCEIYNVIGSQIAGVELIPSEAHVIEARQQAMQAAPPVQQERQATGWLGTNKGWIK